MAEVDVAGTTFTPSDYIAAFKMPSIDSITGRRSSINGAFSKSIIIAVEPSADEIRHVLDLFEMAPNNVRCAYCGDGSTEWDHFRATVCDGLPTGFGSHIKNLVPACGKCNQSRGRKPWREWMMGKAKGSPTTRRVKDIEVRMQRLARYEEWSAHEPFDVAAIAGPELWSEYVRRRDAIHTEMVAAQRVAEKIRAKVAEHARQRIP